MSVRITILGYGVILAVLGFAALTVLNKTIAAPPCLWCTAYPPPPSPYLGIGHALAVVSRLAFYFSIPSAMIVELVQWRIKSRHPKIKSSPDTQLT